MKVVCPKCRVEVPADKVNVQAGIVFCPECEEAFPLSAVVGGGSAGPPERVERPAQTKVVFSRDGNRHIAVMLPRGGPKTLGCFFTFFAVFWNAISWTFAAAAWSGKLTNGGGEPAGEWVGRLFCLPFVAVGIILVIVALWTLFGRLSIAMDMDNLLLRYECLGYKYDRRFAVADITGIGRGVAYTQNGVPQFGVGIDIKGKMTPVTFGSTLTDQERDWLIWEFYDFWKQVQGKGSRL